MLEELHFEFIKHESKDLVFLIGLYGKIIIYDFSQYT